LDSIDANCPECGNTGRTFGEVELDADADFDIEPLGNGEYEAIPMPYWILWFAPQAFGCAVCQYALTGTVELEEAGMSTQRQEVRADDLGEDFDLDELVASEYGSESY
jgi:hypothetical protein